MKQYRQMLDYVVAKVALRDLLFQFVKGNGEFRVDIAPAHAPDDWYDFGEAIDLASDAEGTGTSATHYRMANFRQLLEANIERLRHYFSKETYAPSRRDRTAKRKVMR